MAEPACSFSRIYRRESAPGTQDDNCNADTSSQADAWAGVPGTEHARLGRDLQRGIHSIVS
jgi:hypothetical protein